MYTLLAEHSCKTQELKDKANKTHSLYELTKESLEDALNNAEKLRTEMIDLYGKSDLKLRLSADPYTEIDLLVKDLLNLQKKPWLS